MILCKFFTEPNLTDWIQSIGVLIGIPWMIISYINLKKADIETNRKINSLEDIAKSLSAHTDEYFKQTAEFQFQSHQMQKQTEIMEKQLQFLIGKDNRDNLNLQQETENLRIEKEIKDLKRKNEIRPYFAKDSSGSYIDKFDIKLLNKGGAARKIEVLNLSNEFSEINPVEVEVETKSRLKLTGKISPFANLNANFYNVDFDIKFQDIDGNSYCQNIKRIGHSAIIVSDPKEC